MGSAIDPRAGTAPGDELRKLAAQYGGGRHGAPASSPAGDSLAALAKQYGGHDLATMVGNIPEDVAPGTPGRPRRRAQGIEPIVTLTPKVSVMGTEVPTPAPSTQPAPFLAALATAARDVSRTGPQPVGERRTAFDERSLLERLIPSAEEEANAPEPESALGKAAVALGRMAAHPVSTAQGARPGLQVTPP